MTDAARLYVLAELLPQPPLVGVLAPPSPPCDACPWPIGYVLCHGPQTGCFVLCRVCAERLQTQTVLAWCLQAAFARSVRLI